MKVKSAFTLVELLIVIVIIGILMSALLPRLQGAQDIARDTARQANINQLTTAIMSYRSLEGKFPSPVSTGTSNLSWILAAWILTDFPLDPVVQDYEAKFDTTNLHVNSQDYLYLVMKKNGGTSGAIILGAKMETESKANYVSETWNILDLSGDVKDIIPCKSISQATATKRSSPTNDECTYISADQLRYIVKI